jgi:hypothetical protein
MPAHTPRHCRSASFGLKGVRNLQSGPARVTVLTRWGLPLQIDEITPGSRVSCAQFAASLPVQSETRAPEAGPNAVSAGGELRF